MCSIIFVIVIFAAKKAKQTKCDVKKKKKNPFPLSLDALFSVIKGYFFSFLPSPALV